MPQPITNYKFGPEDRSDFDPELYSAHPLMTYVNLVIGHSANCDMFWHCMAARFLKADYETTYEMLRVLSDSARNQAISAAAHHALNGHDLDLYLKVRRASKPLKKQRDKFAHHTFGVSPKIPNALLLLDTKVLGLQLFLDPDQHAPAPDRANRIIITLRDDLEDQIEVYEADELYKIALNAAITECMVMSLFQALGPEGKRRDGARTWLYENPQSPLNERNQSQQSAPPTHPESPEGESSRE